MTRYLLALLILSNATWLTYLHQRAKTLPLETECTDEQCAARDEAFLDLLQQHRKLQRDAKLLVRQNLFLGTQCRKHRARAEYLAGRTVEEVESYLRGNG